jgi:hypothetical protein
LRYVYDLEVEDPSARQARRQATTAGIHVGEVNDLHSFAMSPEPHEGMTLLVGEPAADD